MTRMHHSNHTSDTQYNQESLLAFAMQLCDEAAMTTKAYFRQPIVVKEKSDQSPVTIADQHTEQKLREMIRLKFPQHGIIGEEFGQTQETDWRWVIDPIDGTRSFISGHPLYACLIALLHHNEPVLSIIDMPILQERFYATNMTPCYLNEQRIAVSHTHHLEQAKLYSTDPMMFSAQQFAKRRQIAELVSLDRFGGDGYLYGMLAAGWIDLVIEADLQPYDFLPLKLIVEQAGGVISDWQGNPLSLTSGGEVIASANKLLHEKALERLQAK